MFSSISLLISLQRYTHELFLFLILSTFTFTYIKKRHLWFSFLSLVQTYALSCRRFLGTNCDDWLKKNNNRIYRTNETCFMNVPKKLQMQQSVCVLCGDSSIRFAGDCEVIICWQFHAKTLISVINLQTFDFLSKNYTNCTHCAKSNQSLRNVTALLSWRYEIFLLDNRKRQSRRRAAAS